MEKQGEIILYQPDEAVKLEVRLEDETVWLTQAQIAELFGTGRQAITKHLKNIFSSSELDEDSVCSILELTASDVKNIYEQKELEESSTVRDFRTVRQEDKRQVVHNLTYYNLDAIISIGFRVNSKRGIQFHQWPNKI